jgi:hypothetical protein
MKSSIIIYYLKIFSSYKIHKRSIADFVHFIPMTLVDNAFIFQVILNIFLLIIRTTYDLYFNLRFISFAKFINSYSPFRLLFNRFYIKSFISNTQSPKSVWIINRFPKKCYFKFFYQKNDLNFFYKSNK